MVMVVQKYTISVIYHQAKEIVIVDTLSQAFITDKTNDPIIKEFEVNNYAADIADHSKTKTVKNKLKRSQFYKI